MADAAAAHGEMAQICWQASARNCFRGHFAAPALARCEEAGCHVEVSWSLDTFPDPRERESVERALIAQHRRETGMDPPWQYGGHGVGRYLAARGSEGDADT